MSCARAAGASWRRTWNKVGTHNAYASQLTSERVLTLSGPRKPMVCSLSSVGRMFHEQAAMFEKVLDDVCGREHGECAGVEEDAG